MPKTIGLIVEDKSDSDVVRAMLQKILSPKRFKVLVVHARGCGKIKSKCRRWAENLRIRGCKALILVQDLDNKTYAALNGELEYALRPSPIDLYAIIIPTQMIEAWLLSDGDALQATFALSTTPSTPNPESIFDPKATLRDLVYVLSGKRRRYVNAIHNTHIAAALNIQKLQACPSFRPFERFAQSIFQ
jgi:hypothetical protein